MTQIHPSAVVNKNCCLCDDVVVGPNCIVHSGVQIDSGTVLEANVVIGPNVKIGRNNRFHPNSVAGGLPQVKGVDNETKLGGLEIGNDNIFREQVTIHPSMYEGEVTKIGDNNFLMIGVHIGHDCLLEDEIVMSNYCQISGHCKVESGVWLSGMVLVHQFTTIGKWSYAAGMAGINHDIPPYLIVSGHYPPRVRGVNKRGVRRAGLSQHQEEKIIEAHRRLYRSHKPLLECVKELQAKDDLDQSVKDIIEIILKSSKHRYGRFLEVFRK